MGSLGGPRPTGTAMRSGPRPRVRRGEIKRKYGQSDGLDSESRRACGRWLLEMTTMQWYVLAGKQSSNNAPKSRRSSVGSILQDCTAATDGHQLRVWSIYGAWMANTICNECIRVPCRQIMLQDGQRRRAQCFLVSLCPFAINCTRTE